VFSGGWTLDAAEVVCVDADVSGWEILDLHARLVDKSLVDMVAGGLGEGERARYRMLETVRGYARRHLEAAGELAATRNRHRDVFIGLAETAEPFLQGFEQTSWFGRLGTEQDNLRVAFETCARDDVDPELGLRLAGALGRFWMVRGHWSEGRVICARVLARSPDGPATPARAQTLNGAGNLAFHQGDYAQAKGFHEQSLAVRRELGDRRGQAMSLNNLGEIARMSGDYREARAFYQDSLAIQEAIDDRWGAAVSYNNLGEVAQAQGEFEQARELHGRAIALWPELGDRWGMAWSLSNLGFVARGQGNLEEARSFYGESLAASREVGDRFGVALSWHALGSVAQEQQDLEGATAYLRESLDIRHQLGDRKGLAESLEAFGGLSLVQGNHARAARLLGAADALRERIQAPLPEEEGLVVRARVDALSEALGPDGFESAWSSGRALFLEQAIALARMPDEASS
jgi:tetratricopeptide (TPR) repeat protein